jgi:hypothetical protein
VILFLEIGTNTTFQVLMGLHFFQLLVEELGL